MKRIAAALAAALAIVVAGCGESSDPSAQASKAGPITIGMSLPLTGPVADRAKPGYEATSTGSRSSTQGWVARTRGQN